MVQAFIEGKADLQTDPLWANSGATSPYEYARWAGEICGMACLKMYLGASLNRAFPTVSLAKDCTNFGGYNVSNDGTIKGLFYKGFIDFVSEAFNIKAQIVTDVNADNLVKTLEGDCIFIASVHPTIRSPLVDPPKRGGHLVLVHGVDKQNERIIFHNPSGYEEHTQKNVAMSIADFSRFYAQRGIWMPPLAS